MRKCTHCKEEIEGHAILVEERPYHWYCYKSKIEQNGKEENDSAL